MAFGVNAYSYIMLFTLMPSIVMLMFIVTGDVPAPKNT